jgi:hypothetical protein
MPKPAINDSLWAEMSVAQKSNTVRAGGATLRQAVAGLLDGPDELSRVCREVLVRADVSLKELREPKLSGQSFVEVAHRDCLSGDQLEPREETTIKMSQAILECGGSDASDQGRIAPNKRRRLGLPRGYLPRLHRHERPVRK